MSLINFFETLSHSSLFVFLIILKFVAIFSGLILLTNEPISRKIKGLTTNAYNNSTDTGLPGNPVSVQLLFAFVVKPLIYKLIGSMFNNIKPEKIKTNFSMIKKTKRLEWLRVSKKLVKNKYVLSKHPKQGSGMISSISYSDGVVEIPEDVSIIKKGDIFDYYDFDKLFY